MTSTLLLPTLAEISIVGKAMAVSSPLNPADFPGWEDSLKKHGPKLTSALTVNRQKQNDCNADSAGTGSEARQFYVEGKITEKARTYLYNACEYVTSPNNVGRDQGTSIQSAVIVQTQGIKSLGVKSGMPLESDYPYGTYERSSSRFAERAKGAVMQDVFISEHGPAPTIDELPLHCAVGGIVHFGVFWGVRFTSQVIDGKTYKVWSSVSNSGGGHALEVVTCLWLQNSWWPAVWNSHGDGLILMPREIYTTYARKQFGPFGGYGIRPDKPVERFHDRRESGGGYV